MSQKFTSSPKAHTSVSRSTKNISSTSISYNHSETVQTKSTQSNKNYTQKLNMTAGGITSGSSYTPVYQKQENSYFKPVLSSINKSPPNQYFNTRDNKLFNEPSSSMRIKQQEKLTGNKPGGLFYSFDSKQATPKQTVTIPPMITASALSSPSTSKPPVKQKLVPPPSLFADKPAKTSIFRNIFSSNRKRGYALILNHYKYVNDYQSTREGTQYDVDKLKSVFDYYKIETNLKSDLKLVQIKTEVNMLKYKDFSNYDCFIIVILTHGNRNEILCASDGPYNFIDVIENPILIENKTLLDKPKIFVMQACRGGDEMPVLETDSVSVSSSRRQSSVAKKNIFKCNATYEGYVSFRNTKRGTVFIQSFCEKLLSSGKFLSIYDVMMKVIDEVSSDPEIPQVPTVVSSMTNPFYFGSLLK